MEGRVAILSDCTWDQGDDKQTAGDFDGFCRALSVWLNKPHVINRRLAGAKIIGSSLTDCRITSDRLKSVVTKLLNKTEQASTKNSIGTNDSNCEKLCICSDEIDKNIEDDGSHADSSDVDLENLDAVDDTSTVIIIRDLHPKQIDRYAILRELIIFDKSQQTAVFYPILKYRGKSVFSGQGETTEPSCCIDKEVVYRLTYDSGSDRGENRMSMKYGCAAESSVPSISSSKAQSHVTREWLRDVLLLKLCRWAGEKSLRTGVTSLKLVPVDKYSVKYQELKQKYGPNLVKIWPENTDPQKFVYEDIAIATYLLLLWEEERCTNGRTDRQSFVDLGCGNGLLVYILTLEGHPGLGIDVRKRKIWEMFGASINLQETAITPSACSLFPEYDWLIGNHSDELTPWIPVMAARSSYTCNYFVLPCCHHDFDRKFSQKDSGRSQYRSYLDFVMEVGKVCGFQVEEDTLRIPSTKRVCFVGKKRIYSSLEEDSMDEKRSSYISQRCQKSLNSKIDSSCSGTSVHSDNSRTEPETKRGRLDPLASHQYLDDVNEFCAEDRNSTGKDDSKNSTEVHVWAAEFQPRSNKERVRNCRDVCKATKEDIVKRVFDKVMGADETVVKVTADGRTWRKGGSLPLPDAAALFDKDVLQQLKCECGGIQTLLRNHHYIFEVSGGCVKLRDTSLSRPVKKSAKKKSKSSRVNPADFNKTFLCWFNNNHPDGCPGTDVSCSYAHGPEQLKERPKFNSSHGID